MEKRYIKPSVSYIDMESLDVMAASPNVTFDGNGGGQITTSEEGATGDVMVKSVWDTEED